VEADESNELEHQKDSHSFRHTTKSLKDQFCERLS